MPCTELYRCRMQCENDDGSGDTQTDGSDAAAAAAAADDDDDDD